MRNTTRTPQEEDNSKGIELQPNAPWTWCNMGLYADALKGNPVNEKFPIVEDTELLSRLRSKGYEGVELPIAPILHERKGEFNNILKRSFRYGLLNTKVNLRCRVRRLQERQEERRRRGKRELTLIASRILYMFGVLAAFLSFHIRE